MKPKHLLVMVLALIFALAATATFAVEAKWLVIKDKNGKCRVISSMNDKTPESIGNSFKTKEEAEKAKEKLCPTPAKAEPAKTHEPAEEKVELQSLHELPLRTDRIKGLQEHRP